jgi:phytoene synthase
MQQSRAITRKSASNLALAFVLLPRAKRDGMSSLYAFCREVDDVADEETVPLETRRGRLEEWRRDVLRACERGSPQFALNAELQPVIERYHLAFEHSTNSSRESKWTWILVGTRTTNSWNFTAFVLPRWSGY